MGLVRMVLVFSLTLTSALANSQVRHRSRGGAAPPPYATKQGSQTSVDWEGTYTFNEGGGRTTGGTGMFVEHTIKVFRRGEELVADVDAAGFQVSVSLRCVAKAEGDRLNLFFESYREDNIRESYRRGQLLLSLRYLISRGKARILTYWAAYGPALRTPRSGRVYFRKIG